MAYALPAALIWGAIGLLFGWLGGIPWLLPTLTLVYALWFGIREALGLPARVPGLAWQVPSKWIDGRPWPAQALTWGITLGPGLVTRNPYAGMWLLPLLLAFQHAILPALLLGVAVGVIHGSARFLGVLRNRHKLDANVEYEHLKIMGAQLRWQHIDGLILLFMAGILVVDLLSWLGLVFAR